MRMTDAEFRAYCDCLNLSPAGRAYLERVRSSPPSRRVGGGFKNVTVRYPSRKMDCIIQAESHRNELAGIYEMEHNPDVLEYYDQPERFKISHLAKGGRKTCAYWYTPDYLVLRMHRVGWEEWKIEEHLPKLAEDSPYRYAREGGEWTCPPVMSRAKEFGFYFRLRSSAEIDWIFQRNIIFLEDYLHSNRPFVSEQATTLITSYVMSQPGITLRELLDSVIPEGVSSDDIYALIATEQLYANWHNFPLAEPEHVPIFHSEEMAKSCAVMIETAFRTRDGAPPAVLVASGATVVWDGRPLTVVFRGDTTIYFLAEDKTPRELEISHFETLVKQGRITGVQDLATTGLSAEAKEILSRIRPRDMAEINQRAQSVFARLAGREPPFRVAERTLRRWVTNYREAERKYGCGYIGLIDRWWLRGTHESIIPEVSRALMEQYIREKYEDTRQQSRKAVWGAYVLECEKRGIPYASYAHFANELRRRPQYEQVKKRQGHRAAYKREPFYWALKQATPRHGDRPFEIVHIDHTQLDIELVCSRTGRNLGKPWVTFMTDAYSRRILAIYLTYDPPSYRSCMMVIRECVRRHGRMPQVVVVDGGKEFHSTYFELLLARYECALKTRPRAKSRFGSTAERLFGTTNTEFVHNLQGNTQIMKLARQVTRSVDPKKHAVWTLERFYNFLTTYVYEIYDTIGHPALLGQSPRDAFAAGLIQGGMRPNRMIPYNEDFIIFTLPSPRKGTARVQVNHGVKVNYIYYWCEEFRNPEIENQQVQIRYDPYNMGVAYALVSNRWVQCQSEYYSILQGRSEKEIRLATVELKKINQDHARNLTYTAKQIAAFLTSAQAEEALLEQRLRDLETEDVQIIMAGGQPLRDRGSLASSFTVSGNAGVGPQEDEDITLDAGKLEVYGDF